MNGILFYITIMFLITCVVAGLPFLLQSANAKDFERVSAYECGFEPFSSARDVFDIQFYLVGIMFIVFDIEIAFLFPWTVTFESGDIQSIEIIVLLSLIFIAGFVYEYKAKALDWNKLSLPKL